MGKGTYKKYQYPVNGQMLGLSLRQIAQLEGVDPSNLANYLRKEVSLDTALEKIRYNQSLGSKRYTNKRWLERDSTSESASDVSLTVSNAPSGSQLGDLLTKLLDMMDEWDELFSLGNYQQAVDLVYQIAGE